MRLAILGLLLIPTFSSAEQTQDGKAIYRANCAFCHGLTMGGGRGPALVGRQLLHGSSAAEIGAVIREGVPGTGMPAYSHIEKDELDRLVGFILEMTGATAKSEPVKGDPAKGREVYARTGCATCHRIGNEGSDYGPELTRIGAGRSAAYLRESLTAPSADIPDQYTGVSVVERDGRRVTGVRINEDTFTVQLRDLTQKYRMYRKNEVREVVHETKSLMPDYKSLPAADLDNLLAYLDSLRGDLNMGAGVKKAEGVR
jgi:putative heme-binding domain-containing protein